MVLVLIRGDFFVWFRWLMNLTHHDEAKTSSTQVRICDRSVLLRVSPQTANSHIKHLTVVASRDTPYTLQKVGPNVHPVFHSFQQTGVCWIACVNYSGWTRLCFKIIAQRKCLGAGCQTRDVGGADHTSPFSKRGHIPLPVFWSWLQDQFEEIEMEETAGDREKAHYREQRGENLEDESVKLCV